MTTTFLKHIMHMKIQPDKFVNILTVISIFLIAITVPTYAKDVTVKDDSEISAGEILPTEIPPQPDEWQSFIARENVARDVFGDDIIYHEQRVGGRLERVDIIRKNGITETYRNNRNDTLWAGQENEIGDLPTMRQWIIRLK